MGFVPKNDLGMYIERNRTETVTAGFQIHENDWLLSVHVLVDWYKNVFQAYLHDVSSSTLYFSTGDISSTLLGVRK